MAILLESVREPVHSGSKQISIGNNKIFLHSEKGGFRDDNEDRVAFAIIENRELKGADLAVGLLADGMGGMREGALASSIAIAAFISYMTLGSSKSGIKELSKNAANYANIMVENQLHGKGGSTLSAIVYGKKGSAAINIGDSRIYHYKDNKLTQLTTDDTILGQIRNEIEDVDRWLNPFEGDSRLAQHLGMGEGFEPHLYELSKNLIEDHDKGFYLLTSDGAHYLGLPMLQQLIKKCDLHKDIPNRIALTADWLGGYDNASVAVMPIRFEFTDKEKQEECIQLKLHGLLNESNFIIPDIEFKDHFQPYKKKVDSQLELFNKNEVGKDRQKIDNSKELDKKPKRKTRKRKPKNIPKKQVEKNKKDEIDATLDFISLEDKKNE